MIFELYFRNTNVSVGVFFRGTPPLKSTHRIISVITGLQIQWLDMTGLQVQSLRMIANWGPKGPRTQIMRF